ncbi:MAG: hypothetical protein H8Z69_02220 [Nanohaloarchaea archaeon]|nr:hypothetical protein [Candidatus Nanohaloarchaea archaeon]
MKDSTGFDDHLDEVEIDPDHFEYLEGPDVAEEGDSYAVNTPLHAIYESKKSRVFASLLSELDNSVGEEALERLSGVSDPYSVAEQLTEEPSEENSIVEETDEGYIANFEHPHTTGLALLERELVEAYHLE